MDRKSFNKQSKRQRKNGTKSKTMRIPRGMTANEMIYSCCLSKGDVASGTSGVISAAQSASISQSSEYSNLATIFTEVRLISFRLRWSNVDPTVTTKTHRRIMFGTNMLMNGTTFSLPTVITEVMNLPGQAVATTYDLKTKVVRMGVPAGLEFLSISDDCPTIPAPFAGSPGVIIVFASGLTASFVYGQVECFGTWHLRGRH